jgi:hypothetical protein
METVRIRDPGWKKVGSGIRDKYPGSATLLSTSKLYISKIKKVADSRIGESGSRYLIYYKLQNLISQKVIKLFEQKFRQVFLYTYTASSANLSSLALSKQKRR